METYLLRLKENVAALRAGQWLGVFPLFNLALAVYLVFIWCGKPHLMPQTTPVQTVGETVTALKEIKPFSYYTGKIKEKDIFASFDSVTQALPEKGDAPSSVQNQISQWKAQWKIVGIILDSQHEAIIEKRPGETFFLHEGEEIEGAKIKSIQEGSIQLEWKNQEFNLVQ